MSNALTAAVYYQQARKDKAVHQNHQVKKVSSCFSTIPTLLESCVSVLPLCYEEKPQNLPFEKPYALYASFLTSSSLFLNILTIYK